MSTEWRAGLLSLSAGLCVCFFLTVYFIFVQTFLLLARSVAWSAFVLENFRTSLLGLGIRFGFWTQTPTGCPRRRLPICSVPSDSPLAENRQVALCATCHLDVTLLIGRVISPSVSFVGRKACGQVPGWGWI